MIKTDASMCKRHFAVAAGQDVAYLNYFIYCTIQWFNPTYLGHNLGDRPPAKAHKKNLR